jgi:hypothetical protein
VKISLFSISFMALASPFLALAQIPGVAGPLEAKAVAAAGGELKRFDLNFPGGTPDQFVAAISTALGAPLNAIIPNEQRNTRIMPIKVFGVTVPELFSALESASTTERPIVTSTSNGGMRNVQFRTTAMGFRPNLSNVSDKTVWSFYSTEPTEEYLEAINGIKNPEPVCQYFQLAPYLVDHSIEDITTAIQTGWKMLRVSPMPQLSFHEETKLLIAVGLPANIAEIPQVLEQLQRDTTSISVRLSKLQEDLVGLEAKKETGWEQKAEGLRREISSLSAEQRVRAENKSVAVPVTPRSGRPANAR